MLTSIIISITILYVAGVSVRVFFILRARNKRICACEPHELSDPGLIKRYSLIYNMSARQAIENAMLADGRELFENHITRTLSTFTETEQLPDYVRQYLINTFNNTLVA